MEIRALCAGDIEINLLQTPFGVSFLFHAACFVKFGLRCKTLCDVLYDTLGEFGAIQAQAVVKIFIFDAKIDTA